MCFCYAGAAFSLQYRPMNKTKIKRVTVYASSSRALAPHYYAAAESTGRVLAQQGMDIVYGGGGAGLMGAMADAALDAGARVYGVIPHFLDDIEVGHRGLTEMQVVDDMHIRKAMMLHESDAVVTLPGGCGTFEELFEVLTFKRLGQYFGPVVLVNTEGYYDRLIEFLEHSVAERFMGDTHLDMWQVVDHPEAIPEAFDSAPEWGSDALRFSAVAALE